MAKKVQRRILTYATEEPEKIKSAGICSKFGGDIQKGIAALAAAMRDQ